MRQQVSNLKYHRPKAEGVLAVQLTAENAHAVARELGARVEEDPKPGDPTDVALWFSVPTLNGVVRLLVGSGPVVGREFASGRIVVWGDPQDFYATYEEQTR